MLVSVNKSAFTCNRDQISSRDETRPRIKKFLFTREFHPGMKRVEFHPGMKFNLKENLPLSMKTCNKTYHFSFLTLSFSFAYFLIKAFPDMVYEIEHNKNYSTNLTTIKCGLNQKQPPEVFYKKRCS